MTTIDTGDDTVTGSATTPPAGTSKGAATNQAATDKDSGHKPLQTSLVISALRCTIVYVVLPIIFPIIGATPLVSTSVSFVACVVAIISAAISIRRFWRAQHRMRWVYTIIAGAVITFSVVSLAVELWLRGQ